MTRIGIGAYQCLSALQGRILEMMNMKLKLAGSAFPKLLIRALSLVRLIAALHLAIGLCSSITHTHKLQS